LRFEGGYPVAVNGEVLAPAALIHRLNEMGGAHGIGRADIVEDRLVGMKSRGVYETPGGMLLFTAHRELEQLVLERRTLALKDQLALRYADLVYEGRWWTTERESLDALVDRTQAAVTGEVRLKLYKGNIIIAGRRSPFSLYNESLASFSDGENYDHGDAKGFIQLFMLPTRAESEQRRRLETSAHRRGARAADADAPLAATVLAEHTST
jgi:argininosuccinate synthase